MKTIKEAKKEILEISKINKYYIHLFNSLTIEELESIKKSNKLDRDMKRKLEIYIAIRSLKPLIGLIAIASIIMDVMKNDNNNRH